jgi:predicted dehydrogenase
MARRIRWGVIGSGGIARRRTIPEGLVPASNAELVSLCGVDQMANARLASQYGAIAANSVAELLDTGIDAVYIATPPHLHLEQTRACAEHGKHVLCEKPLALNVADAGMMIEACKANSVTLGTAFMMRFHACHQAAQKLILTGRLGQPVFARAQLSCWYPPLPGAWRQDPATGGGGSLIDLGGHCLDLLEMMFGPIATVSCLINRTVHSYATEDSAVVTLRFANGALGVVDSFFCMPDEASQNRLELYGTLGSLLASGTIGQESDGEIITCLQEQLGAYEAQQTRAPGRPTVIRPAPVNTYRAEIEEFSQAILEEREPLMSAAIGMHNQKLLSACYESAQTGSIVGIQ